MPYNRKRNFRRRVYYRRRRRRFIQRAPTYGQIGKKIWRDVIKLKGLVNSEFKSIDQTDNTTVGPTANRYLLNGLTKGDDIENRDGRSVRFKSVQLHLKGTIHASASHTSLYAAIVIDKQPSGSNPAVSEIYDTLEGNLRNLANRKRFVVLKRWQINLSQDYPEVNRTWYKRIDMKTIFNNGNAGTIADIQSNSLYLLLQSDETTNQPSVDHTVRLRFLDN